MKFPLTIILIGAGLVVGWFLPQPSLRDAGIKAEERKSERHRQLRQGAKQDLFTSLMSEYEQEKYQFRQASTAEETATDAMQAHWISAAAFQAYEAH